MKFWQFLRFTAAGELIELAKAIERTPIYGIMLGDHVIFPEKIESQYAYSSDGTLLWDAETPWPDPFSSIAAMAAVTERIHFSTNVLILPLRHPVEVARTTATLSQLSRGRYALGTGVGWMEEEFQTLGINFSTRGKRYDEMIDVIELLWTGEMVEYHGEHFDFPRSTLNPRPYSRIPIYLAGGSNVAMRRAASRADGWITGNFTGESIGSILATLRRFVRDAGRDPDSFEVIASCHADVDLYKRLEDLGVQTIVDLPSRRRIGPRASVQEKVDYINYFADTYIAAMAP
jgi:probable F420-dependent oxidoreductase